MEVVLTQISLLNHSELLLCYVKFWILVRTRKSFCIVYRIFLRIGHDLYGCSLAVMSYSDDIKIKLVLLQTFELRRLQYFLNSFALLGTNFLMKLEDFVFLFKGIQPKSDIFVGQIPLHLMAWCHEIPPQRTHRNSTDVGRTNSNRKSVSTQYIDEFLRLLHWLLSLCCLLTVNGNSWLESFGVMNTVTPGCHNCRLHALAQWKGKSSHGIDTDCLMLIRFPKSQSNTNDISNRKNKHC